MSRLDGAIVHSERPDLVRRILALAGFRGPWDPQEGDGYALHIHEHEGTTQLSLCPAHELRPEPIGSFTAFDRCVSTAVMHRDIQAKPTLVFPIRGIPHGDVGHPRGATKVMVAREGGTLAHAHRNHNVPTLALGFLLSDFANNLFDDNQFHGGGHLALLIEWFLDVFAQVRWLRVSPWKDGRPPLLVSFDVEAGTPRRSVGRRIIRLPGMELNRIPLPRPLRGRRLISSRNTLRDVDGEHASMRITLDLRKARLGCAARSHEVVQWQLHRTRGPRPPVLPSHDDAFREFATRSCGPHTNFYCGGLPPHHIDGEESGFHGNDHTHFHLMSTDRLRRELESGCDRSSGSRCRAIRAPGLCWSTGYFRLLDEFDYLVDSSFREINAQQPVVPLRTNGGWWELPVQGNIMHRAVTLQPGEGLPDRMMNLYSHDHELTTPEDRALLEERIAALRAAGWVSTGLIELANWLEVAEANRIDSISEQNGRLVPDGDLAEGTVVEERGS